MCQLLLITQSGILTKSIPSYTLRYTMSYAVVATKIDLVTKRAAMKTADDLGLPLKVVNKALLKQFVRTKSVSLNAYGEEPSEYLKNTIYQAEKDWKTERTLSRVKKH